MSRYMNRHLLDGNRSLHNHISHEYFLRYYFTYLLYFTLYAIRLT